jgi:hypothetical protein
MVVVGRFLLLIFTRSSFDSSKIRGVSAAEQTGARGHGTRTPFKMIIVIGRFLETITVKSVQPV